MVAGTDGALSEPADHLAKPEVTGMQITHTNQKPLGGGNRAANKKNKGLRMCSVHITSSFKKAM
eukprot:10855654-Karenia_brevis.AAC.1